MKLKSTFITHGTEDGQIMLSLDGKFSGMVRSNKTAARIIDLLAEETTRDGIVAQMREEYDAPEGAIERDVDKILAALRSIGAIDE